MATKTDLHSIAEKCRDLLEKKKKGGVSLGEVNEANKKVTEHVLRMREEARKVTVNFLLSEQERQQKLEFKMREIDSASLEIEILRKRLEREKLRIEELKSSLQESADKNQLSLNLDSGNHRQEMDVLSSEYNNRKRSDIKFFFCEIKVSYIKNVKTEREQGRFE